MYSVLWVCKAALCPFLSTPAYSFHVEFVNCLLGSVLLLGHLGDSVAHRCSKFSVLKSMQKVPHLHEVVVCHVPYYPSIDKYLVKEIYIYSDTSLTDIFLFSSLFFALFFLIQLISFSNGI